HLFAHLEEEISRARYFGRSVAILMVRAFSNEPLVEWYPRVLERLRPIDWTEVHNGDAVVVIAPELDVSGAKALAAQIAETSRLLGVGVAIFPDSARNAEALIEASLRATQATTPQRPIKAALPAQQPDHAEGREDHAPIVHSPVMSEIFARLDQVARTTISV